MTGKVAWISIAPVKALGLVHPDEVVVEPYGVRENRRFHLIDANGRMLNGKRVGLLVRVTPTWDEGTGRLTLELPDRSVLSGTIRVDGAVTTDFYGRPVPGRVVVGPWAEALSRLAGQQVSLVRTDLPGDAVDRSSRAGAVTLLGAASLVELGRAARVETPVDGRRFRMNFGVKDIPAHAEDGWIGREVRVGEALVRPCGNVGRCAVTTQNPATGIPDLDTLRVLKGYCDDVPTTEPLPFGVHAEVLEPGRVRVGDAVRPQ